MKQKTTLVWIIIFWLLILVTACKGAVPGEETSPANEEAAPSATTLPTTPPTATLAPTPTKPPTATPSPTPVPAFQIAEAINSENVTQFAELWRIGNGSYETMQWSHDSQYAATGTGAGVFVMDRDGELLFSHLDGWVEYKQIAFSHDNSIMAVGFRKPVWIRGKMPKYISTYALPSGEPLSVIDLGVEFQIERIAFREDGSLVAVGHMLDEYYYDDYVAIVHFDPLTGESLGEYKIQFPKFYADKLEISDDGENLLLHFYDEPNLDLFDTSGRKLGSIPGEDISNIHMNGGIIAFDTWEGGSTIQVYRGNGAFLGTVEVDVGFSDCISSLSIDSAGEYLYVNSYDKHFESYSLPGLKLQEEFDLFTYTTFFSPDFSRGMDIGDAEITVKSLETGEVLGSVSDILEPIDKIALSSDHSLLFFSFTGFDDDWNSMAVVQVWDTSRMEIEKTIIIQKNPEWGDNLESITMLGDGTTLVIHKEQNSSLEFWDIFQGEQIDTFSFSHEVYTVGVSHDGNFVMGADRDIGLEIWNRQTGELLVDDDDIYQYIGFYSPTFTRDNQTAIVGGSDTLVIWDMAKPSSPIELDGNGVVAVNPEGTLLAHHSQNSKELHFYDLVNRKTISVHEWAYGAKEMFFSHDNSLLIISSYDGLFFWDIEAGETIYFVEYSPLEVAFSGDRKLLVTTSYDGTIRLWGIP